MPLSLTRWLPALFLSSPWPIASYTLPSSTMVQEGTPASHLHIESLPGLQLVLSICLFIYYQSSRIEKRLLCGGAPPSVLRNHVRNQARKKTVRHWCPWNLTSQCGKLKGKQWRCTMSLGTSAIEMAIFSRGGIERTVGEGHMTAGQRSGLDVNL